MQRSRCWLLTACLAGCLVVSGAAEEKPDPVEVLRRLEWMPGDYASFGQLLEQAKAAELAESQTLLHQIDAGILFGDVEKLRVLLPKIESTKAEVIKKKGGNDSAREEVNHSIKLARLLVALAEKRPAEIPRRAEIFRMVLFAQQTLEEARMIDSAIDQLAIEKNLTAGTVVTWEQIRVYLQKDTQLYATGATILGDKYGPFVVDTAPVVPKESFRKMKEFLPLDAWEAFAPKE
jgi:hypothetical protein